MTPNTKNRIREHKATDINWNHRKIKVEVEYKDKLAASVEASKPQYKNSVERQKEDYNIVTMITETLDELNDENKMNNSFDLVVE